jgi:hypothetical protein
MDINAAVNYIEKTGDNVLTKLACYAVGKIQKNEAIEAISSYQLTDGGWTKTDKDFLAGISTISSTWVALQWFIWLQDFDSIGLSKTIAYLKRVQNEEGYFDEPQEILKFTPSPWMQPGRYENQLWLTSAVSSKLLELGLENEVDLNKAISFLSDGWDGKRFPMYKHTHWMAMHIFHSADSPKCRSIAEGCKAFLASSLNNNEVDPGDCCAIAYSSLNTGQFAEDLFKLAFTKMESFQADDGGIITNYGEKHRPSFTVEALFLLKKLGRIA